MISNEYFLCVSSQPFRHISPNIYEFVDLYAVQAENLEINSDANNIDAEEHIDIIKD